ncbi:hypothetical protein KGQ64_07390 [bacterium]|nr:hypothetical protein [bacterium]
MAEQAILETRPTEFFRDLVRSAMRTQQVHGEEETEFYLVNLLAQHVRAEPEILDRPLALSFLEAQGDDGALRFERFKRVGDTALFVSGLFTDSLERSLVQPSYYVELGRLAYQRTAESTRPPLREMFRRLAGHFTSLVRVLGEVSSSDLFASDRDTLRIYQRWLLTRGAVDAARLVRRGVIAGEPSPSRQ